MPHGKVRCHSEWWLSIDDEDQAMGIVATDLEQACILIGMRSPDVLKAECLSRNPSTTQADRIN